MRAFVQMRRMLEENEELKRKIEQLESKYDKQFSIIFEAIKQLIHQEQNLVTRLVFGQRKFNMGISGVIWRLCKSHPIGISPDQTRRVYS